MVMMEFDNNDLNEDINDSIYRHDDSLVWIGSNYINLAPLGSNTQKINLKVSKKRLLNYSLQS